MDLYSLMHVKKAYLSLILANCLFQKRKKIIVRRWWERRELQKRDKQGAYKKIFLYYKKHDHEGFRKFVGMTVDQFDRLHQLTKSKLKKYSLRKSLHPELKLSAVLNFLAHGGSVTKQSWFFLVGRSTMYEMIPEVCEAICTALEYCISFPKGQEFLENSKVFNDVYNFPNVIGIVDGKHVSVRAPPKSGALFRNFKQNYSVNLMAACDAKGKIIWVSIGDFGSKNDAGNFVHSSLGIALAKEEVNFPETATIPNTKVQCPLFLIADGGFTLHRRLITPYRKNKSKQMPLEYKIFNLRLQNPRKTIERVFGIMCKNWKILNSKLDFNLKTIDVIILTIVHLYNYTLDDGKSETVSENSSSQESTSTDSEWETVSEWETDNEDDHCVMDYSSADSVNTQSDMDVTTGEDSPSSVDSSISNDNSDDEHLSSDDSFESDKNFQSGEEIRTFFTEYFMSSKGSVTWQWEKL